jgi:hypothetical protein
MTMMPATMLLMRSLVCTKAVTIPAATPASTAAAVASTGCTPATSSVAATAPPSG